MSVLLLALVARLWQIDLTQFYDDPVRHIAAAAAFVETGHLPLSSGLLFSVSNLREPPLITYLFAVPVLLTHDPVWLSVWTSCADALAAVLVCFLAEKLSGRVWVGAAAGALYALNASAITFGRTFYTPALVPLIIAAALLALVAFWQDGLPWALAACLLAIGWAAQLHVVNALFFGVWVAAAVWRWRRVRIWPLAAAVVLILAPLAPYLYLESRTGWADVLGFARYAGLPKTTDLAGIETVKALAGPEGFSWWAPPNGASALEGLTPALTTVLCAALLLGLASSVRRWRRGHWLLVAWVVIPFVATLRRAAPAQPIDRHYLLGMLPALVVLEALGFEAALALFEGGLWRTARRHADIKLARAWRRAAAACFMLLLAGLGATYVQFQRTIDTNTREVDFGVPLRYSVAAARSVRQVVGDDPLSLATPYYNLEVVPSLAGRRTPYAWHWDHAAFVYPRGDSWVLAQSGNFGWTFLTEHYAPATVVIANSAGRADYSLFHLRSDAPSTLTDDPRWVGVHETIGQTLRLEGYLSSGLRAGQRSPISFLWRILDPAGAASHLNQFAHLVDAAGGTVSTEPDAYDMRETWEPGDLVATELDLNLKPSTPTGGYWLETGLYGTFDHHSLGPTIRTGPLKVRGRTPPVHAGEPQATLGDGEIGVQDVGWRGGDVTVEWEALKKPRASYTVFVHAIDDAGRLVAQWDGLPRSGSYPTQLWDPGDVVRDTYHLGLTSAPGLRLEIGMYTQPDVKRLPVRITGSDRVEDHLTIPAPPL